MKKIFTLLNRLSLQKMLLAFILSALCLSTYADDLKPYPVFFPVADYPEFNYGVNTYVTRDNMAAHWYWHSAASWTAAAYCAGATFRTVPFTNGSIVAAPYGRTVTMSIGVNRATYFAFMTPYLNPGTYRVYLGFSFAGGTTRAFTFQNVTMDSVLITPPADTTLRAFNYTVTATAPNKAEVVFTGTGTNRTYDAFCGTATITTPGVHKFHFDSNNTYGTDYGFTTLQFIPVTETNLDADYAYPKFDNSGQVWKSAADSNLVANNTATTGYYLPYQVADPSTYTTKYDVTLDAGLYFADRLVVVKRFEDQWTRMFVDTTDATGKCAVASLPAGKYYIEVNKGQHTPIIEVSASGTKNIGVVTANVNVTYSPELWYVGKKFQVYNSTGAILLKELVIPADGVVPTLALPVDTTNAYLYYVLNEDGTTHFDEGTFSVQSTSTVNLDFTATKYNVNLSLGNDMYGNNQGFTIKRASNTNATYVVSTSDPSGNATVQLPDGTYQLKTNSGLIIKNFTVAGAATNVDITARFASNFCLGKAMAGNHVDVYLSSTGALLYQLIVQADGKIICPGMTNGRFYHNAYKVVGTDTTWITKKFTYEINNANFDLGDCGNLEKPYFLPYPVYFDMCNQPEITWMTAKTFQPGDLQYFKFDPHPTDTIYNVRDTVWTYLPTDTTYVVRYDSSSISSITYWDYNCNYYFSGITYDKIENAYIWGDVMYFRFPAKGKLTIVTPNLNPGRYNVYMSNRWAGGKNCGNIDTCYMDNVPLTTNGARRSFSGTNDDYTGGMYGAGLLRIMNYTTGTSATATAQGALHMGEAVVSTPGRHDFTLYSLDGATTSGNSGGGWWNMIYFIPIDIDNATPNSTYYPRLDFCGNLVQSGGTGLTSLGTDGVNRSTYMAQFNDPSIYNNDLNDYSKTLTVNGGIYSKHETLTYISPIDDWTIKQAATDSITGIATMKVVPNTKPAKWVMEKEHVTGEPTITDNYSVTIPETMETTITSTYSIVPDIDEPALGTYSLTSVVGLKYSYPFYYPITGVVTYSLDGVELKSGGDTIYEAKDKTKNGISPIMSTSMAISDQYLFISLYTGNTTRLTSAMNAAEYTKIKGLKVSTGIWPNPASESVNMKLSKNDGVATYSLYNQLGQLVRKGSFTGLETTVSLNGVQKGMYILRVNAASDELKTKLIVK